MRNCEYHQLVRLKRKAARDGVRVDTYLVTSGIHAGSLAAQRSDESLPLAFFKGDTTKCTCPEPTS